MELRRGRMDLAAWGIVVSINEQLAVRLVWLYQTSQKEKERDGEAEEGEAQL